MVDPNAGLFALPKLKVEVPVLVPPNALLVLPNPPVELPKPVLVFPEPPKRPPPVFAVLEPNGVAAGLLPKREPEALLLVLPKAVG